MTPHSEAKEASERRRSGLRSDQEGRSGIGAYAEGVNQGGRCRFGESFQLDLQLLNLFIESTMTAGKRSKCVLRRRLGVVQTTRTEALAPCNEGDCSETGECFA